MSKICPLLGKPCIGKKCINLNVNSKNKIVGVGLLFYKLIGLRKKVYGRCNAFKAYIWKFEVDKNVMDN